MITELRHRDASGEAEPGLQIACAPDTSFPTFKDGNDPVPDSSFQISRILAAGNGGIVSPSKQPLSRASSSGATAEIEDNPPQPLGSPKEQERQPSAAFYRGLSTNRGLTREFNLQEDYPGQNLLELLGLSLKDIGGLRVLEVGMGGGRALVQAHKFGVAEYHGLDLLPLIDLNQLTDAQRASVEEDQASFAAVAAQYPDYVKVVDFANDEPPYPPDYFDIVISCLALPTYAQNGDEVIRSILNMARVSRARVVCSGAWWKRFERHNPSGIVSCGRPDGRRFYFPMKRFIDALAPCGISYRLLPEISSDSPLANLDLNVSKKDRAKLLIAEQQFLAIDWEEDRRS